MPGWRDACPLNMHPPILWLSGPICTLMTTADLSLHPHVWSHANKSLLAASLRGHEATVLTGLVPVTFLGKS